jgi:hypothetical protein
MVLSATTDLLWGVFGLLLSNFVQELVESNYFVAQGQKQNKCNE